nr:hypothetical protein [Frankia sp. Cppng1_Ct_nod]
MGGASPLAALSGRRAAARDARRAGEATRRAAHTRLARRLAEATDLLAPAGIVLTPLDAGTATSVLAAACNPAGLVPPSALAAPDEVITADFDDPDMRYPGDESGFDDDDFPWDGPRFDEMDGPAAGPSGPAARGGAGCDSPVDAEPPDGWVPPAPRTRPAGDSRRARRPDAGGRSGGHR